MSVKLSDDVWRKKNCKEKKNCNSGDEVVVVEDGVDEDHVGVVGDDDVGVDGGRCRCWRR